MDVNIPLIFPAIAFFIIAISQKWYRYWWGWLVMAGCAGLAYAWYLMTF